MTNPLDFIRETRQELSKVTWPSREETIRLTKVTIIVSLVVSFYLGLLDYGFNQILRLVIK